MLFIIGIFLGALRAVKGKLYKTALFFCAKLEEPSMPIMLDPDNKKIKLNPGT